MELRLCRHAAIAFAVLLTLAACGGGPTPYQQETEGYGYSQQQIEGNRYRVSFSGNSYTQRGTVENYALYRAAEIALAQDGDHFVVVSRDTEANTSYNFPGGLGGSVFGGTGGVGVGVGTGGLASPVTRYIAYMDIVVYRGPKPADDPNSYDSREVVARLGPTLQRAPQTAAGR
ncbi:MAG: hypothetical protein AB7N54_00600 [Alphaproteobacteria bacterium]